MNGSLESKFPGEKSTTPFIQKMRFITATKNISCKDLFKESAVKDEKDITSKRIQLDYSILKLDYTIILSDFAGRLRREKPQNIQ